MENDEHVVDAIKNYIEQKNDSYALQIDGEWGSGKTYFIKEKIIKKDIKHRKSVYFSIYGYQSMDSLKKDLETQIIYDLTSLDKMKAIQNSMKGTLGGLKGFQSLKPWISTAQISAEIFKRRLLDKLLKEQQPVIFIDDLERVSDNIDINEFLGFILNNYIEKFGIKILIVSNIQAEIFKDKKEKFNVMKEKIIGRTIRFHTDLKIIEEDILKNSNNNFIKENSGWIIDYINSLEMVKLKGNNSLNDSNKELLHPSINLRTLNTIIDNFIFLDSKLLEDLKKNKDNLLKDVQKSLFLNVYITTNEYKLGNIDDDNFKELNYLTGRATSGINFNDINKIFSKKNKDNNLDNVEGSKRIDEIILDKYNVDQELKKYLFFNRTIDTYVVYGYIEESEEDYVEKWKKKFTRNEAIALDKLSRFRDLNDSELNISQFKVLEEVKNSKYDLNDLIRVYGLFEIFKKFELIFADEYLPIISEKIKESYKNYFEEYDEFTLDKKFKNYGIENLEQQNKVLFKDLETIKKQNNQKQLRDYVYAVINKNIEVIKEIELTKFERINENIFRAILDNNIVDECIVINNTKAENLSRYIKDKYLEIINLPQWMKERKGDICQLKNEIEKKRANLVSEIGRIDNFKINELLTYLDKLYNQLETQTEY